MTQNSTPPSPDLVTALVQAVVSNPFLAAIVTIIVGLWLVGRLDDALPGKKEPTEEELLAALEKVRNKKKTSPQTKEIVSILKQLIESLENEE